MNFSLLHQGAILLTITLSMTPAWADFDLSREKQSVIEQVDSLEQEIQTMSMELWDYSEIALTESRSAEYLASILGSEGFRVERGVADMPTAWAPVSV